MVQLIVVQDYRGYRIEIVAQLVDGAWNAGVRIRRILSEVACSCGVVFGRWVTTDDAMLDLAKLARSN